MNAGIVNSLPFVDPISAREASMRASQGAKLQSGQVAGSGVNDPASLASPEMREAFDDFVGGTFFGTLLQELRKGQDGPAYLHGGRTEEVFQGQLDQHMVERLSDASSSTFSDPMFKLFMLGRQR